MATLTEPQKLFIIKALACYDTPSRVSAAVREEFGIEVDRRRIQEYDPERAGHRGIGKKLKTAFEEARRRFKEETGDVPIAQKAYRLRSLQRMHSKAEEQGNMALAAQLLEQASKEVGDAFTNRRELTGKNGAPLMPTSLAEMTDEQLAVIAAGGSP